MIVAAASADFADHIYIRQEVHFDAALTFALAGFAAAPGDVEGEASGL